MTPPPECDGQYLLAHLHELCRPGSLGPLDADTGSTSGISLEYSTLRNASQTGDYQRRSSGAASEAKSATTAFFT